MKKLTKILAVLLSVIVCLSAFSIMPYAAAKRPGPKSTEKELIAYHEERVEALLKENGEFKAENEWSISSVVDTSKLPSGVDAKKAQKEYNYSESGDSTIYFNNEDVVKGTFSIADDKETFGLKYKSMKVSQSGDNVTVTLVYTETWGEGKTTDTYTIVYDAIGNILSYRLNQKSTYPESYQGKTITINEEVDDLYTFTYKLTFFDKIIIFFRKLFFWLY